MVLKMSLYVRAMYHELRMLLRWKVEILDRVVAHWLDRERLFVQEV